MQAVVRNTVTSMPGTAIVIGHSLGSILAYDVLREPELSHLRVPLLVTMGSPLGITEIQDHITRPLRVPDPVEQWLNIADPRDLVALDRTIRPEFAPLSRCIDQLTRNDSHNHHDALDYLRSPSLCHAVIPLLESPG